MRQNHLFRLTCPGSYAKHKSKNPVIYARPHSLSNLVEFSFQLEVHD
jgi:hypothetical protein